MRARRLLGGGAVALAAAVVLKFAIDCSWFPWAIECWFAPIVGRLLEVAGAGLMGYAIGSHAVARRVDRNIWRNAPALADIFADLKKLQQ